mmetsp:Transcript_12345/g.26665  ORF Transcript_12345/g.26665 Transcript_12345/m.26665 type:complete len:207 (+) Transcript_12345:69-689(+)|eukprot:CAMPEP_0202894300 /NCGR_PEP_ID=MMETSP1392-20130828/3727_1 /ASSEMBLY_ACC=CAM_ASM_000868 /TAXON_ID=225041 /ORGANISM="Chlamydomonas chlamydogama, Strain SAG 11-48b" /LENGTH=206 /DNA_ID=CAMNT_0049578951 /DNA_START=48 /DNA_END=668 /DNA_ORIENTATION=-
MAVSMKSKAVFSSGVARSGASRASTVRVQAVQGVARPLIEKVQTAGAAIAAAAILAAPAQAGVILEQPKLKQLFQSESTPIVRDGSIPDPSSKLSSSAAPAAAKQAAAPKPKAKDEAPSSDFIDPRAFALPGSVAFVAGLAFAASKVDGGFDEFIGRTLIRDNSELGVGYEGVIKSTYGGIYGEPNATGTKKVKAATQKGKGKGKK